MKSLQEWHENLGIENFPQRFGITTNEKKFREISFRVKKNTLESEATADDVIVSKQTIYGMNHTVAGYSVSYRVWLPSDEGKFPGYITVRFSLYVSVVAIVKVGDFFIAVEHDNFPLQAKAISMPRMFGVTESKDLDALGKLLIEKEYPFLLDNIESYRIRQLGNTVFQDPSSRYEKTLSLLIELTLKENVRSKEELAGYLDHRNKEMILHHIFHDSEVREIFKNQLLIRDTKTVSEDDNLTFRETYSLWALASYYFSTDKDFS